MTDKTVEELCAEGAELVSQDSGSTWNDGGRWNKWVYELPDGTFWRVHQPSDYSPSVKVSQVKKVVTEVVSFVDEKT